MLSGHLSIVRRPESAGTASLVTGSKARRGHIVRCGLGLLLVLQG